MATSIFGWDKDSKFIPGDLRKTDKRLKSVFPECSFSVLYLIIFEVFLRGIDHYVVSSFIYWVTEFWVYPVWVNLICELNKTR